MPLRVAPHVLGATFAAFRACGRGRHECIVYWLGPVEVDAFVDEVVHPVHAAALGGYEIDGAWITTFWLDLATRGKTARLQAHTHPGRASHSTTDDDWALVHTPGFMSLVLPRFAMGAVSLDGAHLVKRTTDGGWRPTRAEVTLRLTHDTPGSDYRRA